MNTKRSTSGKGKNEHITKTSKGFTIRTYELPPPEFDPLAATPRLLLHHGFPSRPNEKTEPKLRQTWDKALSRPRTWITPIFREIEGKTHGPAIRPGSTRTGVTTSKGITNATSSNWSGSVVFAPSKRSFGWVAGQWTVPNPHAPAFGIYYASEWVGIDGWGSNDVLQAGTETEIVNVIFSIKQVYVWWEWFPSGEVAISNFSVSPGDIMYCLICVNSTTTATIYLTNQSSGVSTSFSITAPRGTTLVGNSAEWIVERPTVNGSLTNLTDTKAVYFDEGIAGLAGTPFTIVDLGSGTAVTMTGNNNASLSVPTLETSRLMKVNWLKAN